MSNRALIVSLVAVVAFVATVVWADIDVTASLNAVANSRGGAVCNCQAPDTEASPHQEAMAYAIYHDLAEANTIQVLVASREHPDLASELHYQAFADEVELRHSLARVAPGRFEFEPLAKDPFFERDFAAFRDRFEREHPDDRAPIE